MTEPQNTLFTSKPLDFNNFKIIINMGSSSTQAFVLTKDGPKVIYTSLHVGTDQNVCYEDINEIIKICYKYRGKVALVNSIGYSIDGGKTKHPHQPVLEVTQLSEFTDKKIVSLFANIVNSNPEYEDKFFIINRNYNTPYCKIGGQWANWTHMIVKDIHPYKLTIGVFMKIIFIITILSFYLEIPYLIFLIANIIVFTTTNIACINYPEFVLDLGGGSGTIYKYHNGKYQEYPTEPFMSKKSGSSPNQLYEKNPEVFKYDLMKSLSLYPEIRPDNLLILQTGKMRQHNIPIPQTKYRHMYLSQKLEAEYEALDICNTLFKGRRNVESFDIILDPESILVNQINIIY